MQFHPEVAHTPRGGEIISNFLFRVCHAEPSWTPGAFVESEVREDSRSSSATSRVICGLSGGVDSSVAAALVHRAIGDQLTCVFVDTGLLRLHEREQVERTFNANLGIKLVTIDASKRFLDALAGVEDPERKRTIIGHTFIDVFEAATSGAGEGADFLVQGTLYPDVIESFSPRGGPSVTIKTHHNVGGLKADMKFKLIEPLRELFKDEVRNVGRELGLAGGDGRPSSVPRTGAWHSRPRRGRTRRRSTCCAAPTRYTSRKFARQISINEIWQAFAVLLPVRSVGVMGDYRTYENVCALARRDEQRRHDRRLVPLPS